MKVLTVSGAVMLFVLCGSSASAQQVDQDKLDELHKALQENRIANIHAVLVDHRGQRIFEEYYEAPDEDWGDPLGEVSHTPDRKHDLRSVSKSVTTLLLGPALGDDWKQDLKRTLGSLFPDRSGEMGERTDSVTLEDLLTMRAGIEWNQMTKPYVDAEGNLNSEHDEIRFEESDDPVGLILAHDLVTDPGTEWYYNSGLTQLLGEIIQRETGVSFTTFVEDRLFGPLGIDDYDWRRSGHWPEASPPATASGLRLTANDTAKLGRLILARGEWNGEQLVDPEWIDAMTARHVETIPWYNAEGMNSGYGYMWYRGRVGAHEVIFAVGYGDQWIMVFPDRDLVITVQAGRYHDSTETTGMRIAQAVLAAIDDE